MNILSANRDPFRSFPVLFSLPPVSRPPSPLLITTRAKGTLKFRFAQFQTPPLYRERSSVYTRNWSPTCSSQLSRIVTTLLFQTIRVIELRVFLIFRLNVLHFNDNWGDKWTKREGERERVRIESWYIKACIIKREERISCCNSCKKFLVKILYRNGKIGIKVNHGGQWGKWNFPPNFPQMTSTV